MILSGDGGIIFHVALDCEKLVAGYWTTRYSCGDSVMMFLIWVFSKRSNVGTVVLRNTGLAAILWWVEFIVGFYNVSKTVEET